MYGHPINGDKVSLSDKLKSSKEIQCMYLIIASDCINRLHLSYRLEEKAIWIKRRHKTSSTVTYCIDTNVYHVQIQRGGGMVMLHINSMESRNIAFCPPT